MDTEEDVLHLKDLPTFDGLLRAERERALADVSHGAVLENPARAAALRGPATRPRARAQADSGRPRRVLLRTRTVAAARYGRRPRRNPRAVESAHGHPRPDFSCTSSRTRPRRSWTPRRRSSRCRWSSTPGVTTRPSRRGVLYAARLMTRMHAFVRYLLTESGWGDQVDEAPLAAFDDPTWEPGEGTEDHTSRGCGGWSGGSGARGVRCPGPAARPLLHAAARLRAALDDRVRPTLRRWLSGAVRNGATKAACVLHAHLAYLHWSTPSWRLDRRATQTVLTAQAYILVNHSFHDATEGGAKLRGGKKRRRRRRRGLRVRADGDIRSVPTATPRRLDVDAEQP